ncbi:MAG: EAL domain-containing protein, partial [Lachnospiraceae bacterium]|nr:EAL domain-containing protein [Lachnospiraceae bacterium]
METNLKYSDDMRRLVLVVDDENVNRQLLGYILSKDYEVLYAENGREALEIIRENSQMLSLVLLDLIMPEMDGFELLEVLRADEELKRIPIIVLTSEESAEVKSLKLGAADFIKKPYDMPEVILARVWRIIELSEDKNIIQAAEKDELTGLYTPNFFYEYALQLQRYHKNRVMDAVALNIDHFHLVNELHGRDFGDRVLKLIADQIVKFLKGTLGIACRSDADTFFLYCAHQDDYNALLDQVLEGLSELSETARIRLRIGVYEKTPHDLEMEQRFDRARTACNSHRGNYSKSIAYYDIKLHENAIFAERLINDIHEALEQKQLKVFYQPKYNIQSEKPVLSSAEALIRWQHPEFGMVNPGVFIPLFEQNGLIQMLDNYVWREAAAQIREWKDKFGVSLPVSVNVSRIDIYDPELEEKLAEILEENGLTTADLYLEITESAYAEDAKLLVEVVEDLRAYGFRIEMDDFGSGYSSLNMLSMLPIDVLKLDMKFIRNMNEDET